MTELLHPVGPVALTLDEILRRNKALKREEGIASETLIHLVSPMTGRFIEGLAYLYRLHGVDYNNGTYAVDIMKYRLGGGSGLIGDTTHSPTALTQDEWLKRYPRHCIDDLGIPDGPMYASIILALYLNKDIADPEQRALVAECKEMLAGDFETGMTTSTKTHYALSGDDTITHGYNTTHKKTVTRNIKGVDCYITELDTTGAMETLLGVSNRQTLNDALSWMTGKDSFLWRMDRPAQADDRALVLGVSTENNRFNINANGYVSNRRFARGVSARRIDSSETEVGR